MAAQAPFPVDPADVPDDAVRVVKRTILRHADRGPYDDDLARLIVAGVIAILSEPEAGPGDGGGGSGGRLGDHGGD